MVSGRGALARPWPLDQCDATTTLAAAMAARVGNRLGGRGRGCSCRMASTTRVCRIGCPRRTRITYSPSEGQAAGFSIVHVRRKICVEAEAPVAEHLSSSSGSTARKNAETEQGAAARGWGASLAIALQQGDEPTKSDPPLRSNRGHRCRDRAHHRAHRPRRSGPTGDSSG